MYNEKGKVVTQQHHPKSRYEIIKEIEDLGMDASPLGEMPIEDLNVFLIGFQKVLDSYQQHEEGARRSKSNDSGAFILSGLDKRMLIHLVKSEGHVSSLTLSRELDIPISTVQRRRKRLEDKIVERNYLLDTERLGWRRAMLLVSIDCGAATKLGEEILEVDSTVESVHRMLGANGVDLKVDVLFRTNNELLSLIDKVKSKEGVKNVLWSEPIKLIGRNQDTFKMIIDSV